MPVTRRRREGRYQLRWAIDWWWVQARVLVTVQVRREALDLLGRAWRLWQAYAR